MKRVRHIFFMGCGLVMAAVTYGQNCLGFTWQIKGGDSVQWRSADFIPRNWGRVNIGVDLERQGYGCCSGYYGLWNQVDLPIKYRNVPGGRLQLRFKFDAEKAEVFFNGIAVGNSSKPRSEELFELPRNLIHWNEPNQVFVRLLNPYYTGGPCTNYIHIEPGKSEEPIFFEGSFDDKLLVFKDTVNVQFAESAKFLGGQFIHGIQEAIVIDQFNDTVYTNKTPMTANAYKSALLYKLGTLQPGFYQVQFHFYAPGIEAQRIDFFAVAPEAIRIATINQQEVAEYWSNAIKELKAIDPQYTLIKVDSLCTEKNNVYILEMKSLGNLTVRGWYITPAKAGVYPAILHFQGYSVAWKPQWFLNDTDVVHLALDIRGHGLSADVIKAGFGCPGYVGINLAKPEQYIYRGAYMDAYRAFEFLLSSKEVDTSRIAVDGHSQGGALSVATAALHAGKVFCCITASPWLCDFADHIRIRPLYWEEMEYYMQHDNVSKEQVYKTMNLVDIINLCQRVECPVLMGTGLLDDDCPSYIDFAMYNLINAPKEYRMLREDGHLLGKEWGKMARDWTRKQFGLPVAP